MAAIGSAKTPGYWSTRTRGERAARMGRHGTRRKVVVGRPGLMFGEERCDKGDRGLDQQAIAGRVHLDRKPVGLVAVVGLITLQRILARDRKVGDTAVGVTGIQRDRGRRALFHGRPISVNVTGAGGDHTVPRSARRRPRLRRLFWGCRPFNSASIRLAQLNPWKRSSRSSDSVPRPLRRRSPARSCGAAARCRRGSAAAGVGRTHAAQPRTAPAAGRVERTPTAKRDHRSTAAKALIKPELRWTHRRPGERIHRLQRDVFSHRHPGGVGVLERDHRHHIPGCSDEEHALAPVHRRTAARRGPG